MIECVYQEVTSQVHRVLCINMRKTSGVGTVYGVTPKMSEDWVTGEERG